VRSCPGQAGEIRACGATCRSAVTPLTALQRLNLDHAAIQFITLAK
jgi:hypothetical protein